MNTVECTHSIDTRRPIDLSNLRCGRASVLVVRCHTRARGDARLVNGDEYEQRCTIGMYYVPPGLPPNLYSHRESAFGGKKPEGKAKDSARR